MKKKPTKLLKGRTKEQRIDWTYAKWAGDNPDTIKMFKHQWVLVHPDIGVLVHDGSFDAFVRKTLKVRKSVLANCAQEFVEEKKLELLDDSSFTLTGDARVNTNPGDMFEHVSDKELEDALRWDSTHPVPEIVDPFEMVAEKQDLVDNQTRWLDRVVDEHAAVTVSKFAELHKLTEDEVMLKLISWGQEDVRPETVLNAVEVWSLQREFKNIIVPSAWTKTYEQPPFEPIDMVSTHPSLVLDGSTKEVPAPHPDCFPYRVNDWRRMTFD